MDELKAPVKPFEISKRAVQVAWEKVKANRAGGAAGASDSGRDSYGGEGAGCGGADPGVVGGGR